jgi:dipeptidyl aminopeptidase/acylaminoacyl peptidase
VVGKVGPLAWSRDGRWIAWLGGVDGSDPAAGSVFVAPAAGGPPKDLTAGREETAVDLAWRPDGRLAVASVVSTRAKLAFVDPATGAWETVLGPGPVVYTAASFSADGRQLALVGSTSAHEPDVYGAVLPVRAAPIRAAAPAPTLRRLVHSNPALADLPRGAQETIRYKAGDGLDLEGVLIRPHGHREGARCPLVVVVHGGPEGQYLDGWLTSHSAPGQALAERGFAVFFPNYRGSTGRGVAFAKADHRDLGGKEFTDVLDGIDALVERGLVDGRRVGMMGGSYGGYFTALAVTRHSARFAAGVEMFGITSWESFLGQTDIPRENAVVHWALSCYEQPALCRERSAIGNLDRARTPTLILQGAEDLRVPRPQSDELHAGLRERGVSVEYVVYPREGHGFRERAHRLDALTRILGWFERHLRPRT